MSGADWRSQAVVKLWEIQFFLEGEIKKELQFM